MRYLIFKINQREWRNKLIASVALAGFLLASPLPFWSSTNTISASPSLSGEAVRVSLETREGRLVVFDDVWQTIRDRYYDRRFNGIDWEAQREAFREPAAEAGSAREFYSVLRRMITALNDPHTRVYAQDEKFDWRRPRFVSVGVSLREVEGRPTVVYVEPDSGPDQAGIRAGDIIEKIDGELAASVIRSRIADLPAQASVSARRRVYAKLLDGRAETSVLVQWRGKDDKPKSAHFQRRWRQRELGMRVQEKNGYAVVEIDAFTRPIITDFARALRQKLRDVYGIVLDLRNNGGGDAQAMAGVASAFLGEGYNLGRFLDRSETRYPIFAGAYSMIMPERITENELPLVVLVSERSSSASEILVAALKSANRARIIGGRTCGCVLAIRNRHDLPDGGLLDVSEMNYQTSAGDRLEGRGVDPHETVNITRKALYAGRDPTVERAIEALQNSR